MSCMSQMRLCIHNSYPASFLYIVDTQIKKLRTILKASLPRSPSYFCLRYSVEDWPYSSLKQLRKYPKSLKPLAYAASDTLYPPSKSNRRLCLSLILRINSFPDIPVNALTFRYKVEWLICICPAIKAISTFPLAKFASNISAKCCKKASSNVPNSVRRGCSECTWLMRSMIRFTN